MRMPDALSLCGHEDARYTQFMWPRGFQIHSAYLAGGGGGDVRCTQRIRPGGGGKPDTYLVMRMPDRLSLCSHEDARFTQLIWPRGCQIHLNYLTGGGGDARYTQLI